MDDEIRRHADMFSRVNNEFRRVEEEARAAQEAIANQMKDSFFTPTFVPKAELFFPEAVFNAIKRQIEIFGKKLSPDEAVLAEVSLPDGRVIIAHEFSWANPNIIVVLSTDASGHLVRALIPHTSVHLVLTAVPREESGPAPIGFNAPPRQDTTG